MMLLLPRQWREIQTEIFALRLYRIFSRDYSQCCWIKLACLFTFSQRPLNLRAQIWCVPNFIYEESMEARKMALTFLWQVYLKKLLRQISFNQTKPQLLHKSLGSFEWKLLSYKMSVFSCIAIEVNLKLRFLPNCFFDLTLIEINVVDIDSYHIFCKDSFHLTPTQWQGSGLLFMKCLTTHQKLGTLQTWDSSPLEAPRVFVYVALAHANGLNLVLDDRHASWRHCQFAERGDIIIGRLKWKPVFVYFIAESRRLSCSEPTKS